MKPRTRLQMAIRRRGWRLPEFLIDSATRDMRDLANTMSPNDVVLDFGAHVGNATIEFAQRAKHVHAFEPNPETFGELQRQTARYTNVTLHNKIISDKAGVETLFFENVKRGKHFEGSTIMEGKTNVSYENRVDVEALDVSDFVKSLGEPVACVKMDIEGAEYRVLDRLLETGAIHDIGRLYVECHVDRIPGLAKAKEKTLEHAKAEGVLDKLDFDWQ